MDDILRHAEIEFLFSDRTRRQSWISRVARLFNLPGNRVRAID